MMMQVLTTLGGVGLFLLGMEIMTTALREVAGAGLRQRLALVTASPLRGVITGALATAAIQSSTAVSLITIGAVGAGLLSVSHTLGVLYGANIGTTVTGWLVVTLGLKLQLGVVALPVLFGAAMLAIAGSGARARTGRALAGFCLLFLGLDMMQEATHGAAALLRPDVLPGEGWAGRLLLVGVGLALVALIQSSSAAMALVLVLLGAGALSFVQATALAIGFNVGTTVTGLLAVLGGSQAMRRTAVANLLFKAGTAVLVFPVLGPVAALLSSGRMVADAQIMLMIFHTGFNIFGMLIFLPLTERFAALVERLVPERSVPLAEPLDPRLLAAEGAAMDAAQQVADRLRRMLFTALAQALEPGADLGPLATVTARGKAALEALNDYLSRIRIPPDRPRERARLTALLHQMDHFERLLGRCTQRDRIATLREETQLRRDVAAMSAAMRRDADAARLARLERLIEARTRRTRRASLLREHAGLIAPNEMFARTDALRWLRRVAHHAARLRRHAETASAVS